MPTPTPTDTQIVAVRRIVGLTSRQEVEGRINALNDAEWAAAIALVNRWTADDLDADFGKLTGKVADDTEDERRGIAHALRTILGLSPFSDEELGPGYSGSSIIPVRPVW